MSLLKEWHRLRELEWRELDVREAGDWPWSLQLVCCLVVLGTTFAIMHWYLVAPKVEALVQAQHQETRLLAGYQQQASQAAGLPLIKAQAAALAEHRQKLRDTLPSAAEVPQLIDAISAVAVGNGLSIGFIRLAAPQAHALYSEQPFDLQVVGSYHDIAAFLAALAELEHIVTSHDFTLAPVDGDPLLQLSMLARTYTVQRGMEEQP